jgi:phosphate/sulfate permease
MSRRPVKLLAVWVLVALALTFLLSLALPFPASLCMTLTASALGYGLLLLARTGRDLT